VIVAAGLLVLLGLGLFLAGVLTGTTAFYWLCVAVCVLAAVLLFAARRRIAQVESASPGHAVPAAAAVASAAPAGHRSPSGTTRVPTRTATFPAVSNGEQPAGATASGAGAPAEASTGAHAVPPRDDVVEPPAPREPEQHRSAPAGPPAGAAPSGAPVEQGDPPIEDVEVTDLLLVVDLKDEVLVIDEHPRYHLSGCAYLRGRTEIPLPLDEARADGFTPCAVCAPDRHLADRERARKHSGGAA
jgi:membrane protein implicated in regulation of membrane protease activity